MQPAGLFLTTSILLGTLVGTRAALPTESEAIALAYSLRHLLAYGGGLAGIVSVVLLVLWCWQTKKGAPSQSQATLLIAAGATLIALNPLLHVTLTKLPFEQVIHSQKCSCILAINAISLAYVGWMLACRKRHILRIAKTSIMSAEMRAKQSVALFLRPKIITMIPRLWLISTTASMIVMGLEALWCTQPRTAAITCSCGIGHYWIVLISLAILTGGACSFIAFSLGASLLLTLHKIPKRIIHQNELTFVLGMFAGIICAAFIMTSLASAFLRELSQLNLMYVIISSALIAGTLYGICVSVTIQQFFESLSAPLSPYKFNKVYLMSMVLFPAGAITRILGCPLQVNKKTMAAVHIVLGGALFALLHFCYPRLHDASNALTAIWSAAILLCLIAMLCIAIPAKLQTRRQPLKIIASMIVISTLALTTCGKHSVVRMLIYEYSSIARLPFQLFQNSMPRISKNYGTFELPPPGAYNRPQHAQHQLHTQQLGNARPLIVVVIMDACRPDHMGIYDYRRTTQPKQTTTPNFERYRNRLIIFKNAFAQATATSCSLRHMHTGVYSSRKMIKNNDGTSFYTENLMNAGYHTLILNIIGSDYNGLSTLAFLRTLPPHLLARINYHCIEDSWIPNNESEDIAQRQSTLPPFDAMPVTEPIQLISFSKHFATEKIDAFFAILDQRKDERGNVDANGVYAFLHLTETHFPWRLKPYGTNYGPGRQNRYDHEVSCTDAACGRLLDGLRDRKLLDESLVIFAADHGTGLSDHGQYGGFNPYAEQIRIPLLMHVPGVTGGRIVESLVGLFDIAPTLISLFDPTAAHHCDAKNLWPLIWGKEDSQPRVLFGLSAFEDAYYCIDSDGFHYIWHRDRNYEQLYKYSTDPGEKHLLNHEAQDIHRCQSYMKWFVQNDPRGYTYPYFY